MQYAFFAEYTNILNIFYRYMYILIENVYQVFVSTKIKIVYGLMCPWILKKNNEKNFLIEANNANIWTLAYSIHNLLGIHSSFLLSGTCLWWEVVCGNYVFIRILLNLTFQ